MWNARMLLVGALVVGMVGIPTGAETRAGDPNYVPRGYVEAFAEGDYEVAKRDLESQLATRPTDKFLMYNLACAHAMLGERAAAIEALLDALSFGFVDFYHMERDSHLASIREETKYRTIVENWKLVLDARADAEMTGLRKAFGEQYAYEKDGDRRVIWASAFRPAGFASAKAEVARVDAWASGLFDEPAPAPSKPPAWVHVVLPSTADFLDIVGSGRIGGYYDKDNKRLISRDIGPSLRHEFFHVLHWRHMDRIGQHHPIWLQEGLASLLEDIDGAGDVVIIRPSWRTNIAKRLAKGGRLTPWKRLFSMSNDDFVGRRPRATYAQARAVVMFLHERGVLEDWYEAYVEGFDEDPTGLSAMSIVFESPLKEVERAYRLWLLELEQVADIDRPKASLGVALGQGAGDGPVVDEVVAMKRRGVGGKTGNRLRQRDVITAIEGRTVRTLDDLYRVLGEYGVGDEVVVTVRRGSRVVQVPVELVEPE